MRDRLLGVLGHDLKNPLHVISLAAEELLATGDTDAARLSLRIKASARRMNRMVEDLLDYARSDLGEGIPIDPTWCYMDDVCLLTNALHHGEDPVRIRLRGTPALPGEASWQIVEVSNRGQPIPEEDLVHLFQPFYRSWSARRRSQGWNPVSRGSGFLAPPCWSWAPRASPPTHAGRPVWSGAPRDPSLAGSG